MGVMYTEMCLYRRAYYVIVNINLVSIFVMGIFLLVKLWTAYPKIFELNTIWDVDLLSANCCLILSGNCDQNFLGWKWC